MVPAVVLKVKRGAMTVLVRVVIQVGTHSQTVVQRLRREDTRVPKIEGLVRIQVN